MDRLERNKKNVIGFYVMMFNQSRPREAMDRYAGKEYIQHNPHVGDGKEPFAGGVVEHWDVLQRVPPQSANSNSMF